MKINDSLWKGKYQKEVEKIVTSKNIPMTVEEILLEQAKEEGREEEREKTNEVRKKLKEGIRNLLKTGLEVAFIAEAFDVSEEYVRSIQKTVK